MHMTDGRLRIRLKVSEAYIFNYSKFIFNINMIKIFYINY